MLKDSQLIEKVESEIETIFGERSISKIPESIRKSVEAIGSDSDVNLRELESIGSGLARMIDYTLLKPDATIARIDQLCAEALEHGFFSVCVNPIHISRCKILLEESYIKVCTVVGFPLGCSMPSIMAHEAKQAESEGADEIDMVINVGALKDNDLAAVYDGIEAVVRATSRDVITKVILENAYLTIEEKVKGCLLAKMAGADFVKTSTGFGPSGATLEDVILMRRVVGDEFGVKAAGRIRDRRTALRMVKAGASRIGTSASVSIVTGSENHKSNS